MIEVKNLSKRFENITALNNVSMTMKNGEVFGLIGTNGAGKSTLLRILSGIYLQDEGTVTIDGGSLFESTAIRENIFYISDEQYYFQNATSQEMMNYYQMFYPKLDREYFEKLCGDFGLERSRKIRTFSKGMRRQLFMILGLSSNAEYLLCDETFDGLDSVMRQAVKSLMAASMVDRKLTPVIASHNLRELEDMCDHVGLLHKGGILLSEDLNNMKLNLHKLQCVFPEGTDIGSLSGVDIIQTVKRGSLYTFTVRGDADMILHVIQSYNPVFCELIPLSLEEIFIAETEVAGYDIKALVC